MNRIFDNLILNTDSYKSSHYLQYPQGAQFVSSYIESRGGDYQDIIFFGLQMFIKSYLLNPITSSKCDELIVDGSNAGIFHFPFIIRALFLDSLNFNWT